MKVEQLKSQATLLGKLFAEKGVKLSRAEQLDFVARFNGTRNWQVAEASTAGLMALKLTEVDHWEHRLTISFRSKEMNIDGAELLPLGSELIYADDASFMVRPNVEIDESTTFVVAINLDDFEEGNLAECSSEVYPGNTELNLRRGFPYETAEIGMVSLDQLNGLVVLEAVSENPDMEKYGAGQFGDEEGLRAGMGNFGLIAKDSAFDCHCHDRGDDGGSQVWVRVASLKGQPSLMSGNSGSN